MSWIGVMVGASIGAGSSGLMTGLNGGSTEDILKSVAIGGTVGGIGGGIGSALSGPAAGAATGSTSGAVTAPVTAPVSGAVTAPVTAPVTTSPAQGINSLLPQAPQAGSMSPVASNSVTPADIITKGDSLANNSLNVAGEKAAGAEAARNFALQPLPPAQPGSPDFVGPSATQDQIANASAYTDANMGTRLLADAFGQQGNIVGNTGLKMAGSALQGGAINAGISGLMAGAQGKDVGEGMAKGAATGMIGGAATGAMSGMDNAVGRFATEHPYITSGGIGLAANMALDKPYGDTTPEDSGIKSKYRWNPNTYRAYLPRGNSFGSFAAGGITDLDNYDQAPQMQNPGTLDIPNRNEVANNQGYMGDSVQMMAGGGILGSLPGANLMQSVYNTTLGDVISPDLRDFLFGTPDDQLSPEQRRKKAELMRQEGASKGMAHGGISDLGGYSDGGRLLKGPGDGVSDDIPASIGGKQPARLAEGEFVVPARIVSELGNGSTDAGAKRLYQMMDRIQSDRKKTTGKGKFSDNPKAYKHLPA